MRPRVNYLKIRPRGSITPNIRMRESYEDPLELKPWRFSDKRKEDGEGIRHQMVTTSLDYLLFGGGRPACPGRFFAVNELKALMFFWYMAGSLTMHWPSIGLNSESRYGEMTHDFTWA
ncbi:hypothetical protein EDD85DRAFT_959990 [Armillaria nabsnona]|nr:hypothetical protein EDD85DRAFT_963163 [Armillaria nabsnona]KAK0222733.1 hypothetical protein EDD85DRAFT_959990 [Armillaria nabsnona]